MATPPHQDLRSRIAAEAVRREKPSPAFRTSRIGILLTDQSRESNGNALGNILSGHGLSHYELLLQRLGQAMREQHNAPFIAFRLMDMETPAFKVEILDSQVEGLTNSQTATVDEVDD